MGQTTSDICCSNQKVESATYVSLKPGTYNENSSSLFSTDSEAPDKGYFELENTTAKTIAIKVAHQSTPEMWAEQPITSMQIVKPKETVCGYFDPSEAQMELYVLYSDSYNLSEEAVTVDGEFGNARTSQETGVATWRRQAAYIISCKNKNAISRFKVLAMTPSLELVSKGLIKEYIQKEKEQSSKSGINVETNATVVKKMKLGLKPEGSFVDEGQ